MEKVIVRMPPSISSKTTASSATAAALLLPPSISHPMKSISSSASSSTGMFSSFRRMFGSNSTLLTQSSATSTTTKFTGKPKQGRRRSLLNDKILLPKISQSGSQTNMVSQSTLAHPAGSTSHGVARNDPDMDATVMVKPKQRGRSGSMPTSPRLLIPVPQTQDHDLLSPTTLTNLRRSNTTKSHTHKSSHSSTPVPTIELHPPKDTPHHLDEHCHHNISIINGTPKCYHKPGTGYITLIDCRVSSLTHTVSGIISFESETPSHPSTSPTTQDTVIMRIRYSFDDVNGPSILGSPITSLDMHRPHAYLIEPLIHQKTKSSKSQQTHISRITKNPIGHVTQVNGFKYPYQSVFIRDLYTALRQSGADTGIHNFMVDGVMCLVVDVYRVSMNGSELNESNKMGHDIQNKMENGIMMDMLDNMVPIMTARFNLDFMMEKNPVIAKSSMSSYHDHGVDEELLYVGWFSMNDLGDANDVVDDWKHDGGDDWKREVEMASESLKWTEEMTDQAITFGF